jgi:hypothetical protein
VVVNGKTYMEESSEIIFDEFIFISRWECEGIDKKPKKVS